MARLRELETENDRLRCTLMSALRLNTAGKQGQKRYQVILNDEKAKIAKWLTELTDDKSDWALCSLFIFYGTLKTLSGTINESIGFTVTCRWPRG